MSVMSPSGQKHAERIEEDLRNRQRDLSVSTRGERIDSDDDSSRQEVLAKQLGKEASDHLLEGPHIAGLLEPEEEPEADIWEREREQEEHLALSG